MDDSRQRKAIARALLAADVSDVDEDALVLAGTGLRAPEAVAPFPFSYPDGLAPVPRPLATPPASDAPMPEADEGRPSAGSELVPVLATFLTASNPGGTPRGDDRRVDGQRKRGRREPRPIAGFPGQAYASDTFSARGPFGP